MKLKLLGKDVKKLYEVHIARQFRCIGVISVDTCFCSETSMVEKMRYLYLIVCAPSEHKINTTVIYSSFSLHTLRNILYNRIHYRRSSFEDISDVTVFSNDDFSRRNVILVFSPTR